MDSDTTTGSGSTVSANWQTLEIQAPCTTKASDPLAPSDALGKLITSDAPGLQLFDVFIGHVNELVLVPKCALAQSILAMWSSCGVQPALRVCGPTRDGFGESVQRLALTFDPRPRLSAGGDPYWTGMPITQEEARIARQAVERHRARELEAVVAAGTAVATPRAAKKRAGAGTRREGR